MSGDSIPLRVYDALKDSLTEQGVWQWWTSRNGYLGAEPRGTWKACPDAVLEAAAAYTEGVYL